MRRKRSLHSQREQPHCGLQTPRPTSRAQGPVGSMAEPGTFFTPNQETVSETTEVKSKGTTLESSQLTHEEDVYAVVRLVTSTETNI